MEWNESHCYRPPCADRECLLLLHRHPPARRLLGGGTARQGCAHPGLEGRRQAASGSAACVIDWFPACTAVTPAHQGGDEGPPLLLQALHSSLAVDSLLTAGANMSSALHLQLHRPAVLSAAAPRACARAAPLACARSNARPAHWRTCEAPVAAKPACSRPACRRAAVVCSAAAAGDVGVHLTH